MPSFADDGGENIAANHLAQGVKRDGLTIANLLSSIFSNAILGAQGVRYKLDDFSPLGSPVSGGPYTLIGAGPLPAVR